MSLAEVLERAAVALPGDAEVIRPANGDPVHLLELLGPAAAEAGPRRGRGAVEAAGLADTAARLRPQSAGCHQTGSAAEIGNRRVATKRRRP